tara:strand:- start:289 stop:1626 length:1338 start_codon:yes stop_codon:yes gene_type:complete
MLKDFYRIIVFFFVLSSVAYAEISYREILEKPTDLELNLNFAKQEEKAGNLKNTIATLERLSMLYPSNTEIKLYLLSIIVKMDSPAKLSLLVQSIISDPNTNSDTKKLVAELLEGENKLAEKSKWFAYMDLSYSQTEDSNYDNYSESGKRMVMGSFVDFDLGGLHRYDKSYKRGSALTVGKNIDDTSSLFLNLGLDINTLNKKETGESDVINASASYFKIIGKHYITPYVYILEPNYRGVADTSVYGLGLNNTYIHNEKRNFNYAGSVAHTKYKPNATFPDSKVSENDVYSFSIKDNINITNKNKYGKKLIWTQLKSAADVSEYNKIGFELSYAHILPFGTINLSNQISEKRYRDKNVAILGLDGNKDNLIRKDHQILSNISLKGQLNQLLPFGFVKSMNKKNNIFYDISFTDIRTDSNIHTYTTQKDLLTFGLTKRLNFDGLFN